MSIPYEFRYARLVYMRWLLAGPHIIALAGLSTYYAIRGGMTTFPPQPLIAAIDTSPLAWPLIFAVPGILLFGACLVRVWIAQAYVLAATAFWFYACVLIYAAIFAGAGWGSASMSLAFSLQAIFMGLIYSRGR